MCRFDLPCPALLLVTLILVVGCDSVEPIGTYSVKKHDAIQIPIDTEATKPMENPTHRMLATIILDDDVAWYFKGIALSEKFPRDAAEHFDTLLASLRFEDEAKPKWELGKRWQELPGSGMRVANLMMDDFEFAVSKLTMPGDVSQRQYVLENINRWRRQLQLRSLSSAQLATQSHKVVTADGHDATVIDYQGKQDVSAMPPMARGNRMPGMVGGPDRLPSKPFQSDTPPHWRKLQAGTMQLVAYEANDGEASVTISASKLMGTAGGVLLNVNRWRGQVGLPPVADEKEVDAEPIKVSDTDSLLLEFLGDRGKSMFVAMVPHDGSVWFFKMLGDSSVVEREATAFRNFLSSIRLN